MFDPVRIVEVLNRHDVRYVAIGMFAAYAQGAVHTTEDIDITYDTSPDNLTRLAAALNELGVRFRVDGVSHGVDIPGGVDAKLLAKMTAPLTFVSSCGDVDVIRLPAGTRGYPDFVKKAKRITIADGVTMVSADIGDILRSKQAANRVKDHGVLPALRQLAGLPPTPVILIAPTPAPGPIGGGARPAPKVDLSAPLTEYTCSSCPSGSDEEPERVLAPGNPSEIDVRMLECPTCGSAPDPVTARELEGRDRALGWDRWIQAQ